MTRRCAALLLGFLLTGEATADSDPLRVLTFNVLAPIWAGSVWYPELRDTSVLERGFRRDRTSEFLRSVREQFDVVCLQEVNEAELGYYLEALGDGFEGYMARNGRSFWSNWLVPEIPWEPNGTAIIWRRVALVDGAFTDLRLSRAGNHGAILQARTASGRWVRAFSVHLDSNRQDGRIEELRTLLSAFPKDERITDIVCGDINEDTVTGAAAGILRRAGFVDVLASIGNRSQTHPWSTRYYKAPRWAIIDHVLVRNGLPVAGEVMDFGLDAIVDESARIESSLRISGSDHYPVAAMLELPAPAR